MASGDKKDVKVKSKQMILWAIGAVVLLIGLVLVFWTPSAESVFKDMSDKMLQTQSVTIDQTMTMKDSTGAVNSISSRLYMDMSSTSDLSAKGNFSIDVANNTSPVSVAGDLTKVGEDGYVRYSKLTSSDSELASSLSAVESKLKNKWVKIRDGDQFAAMANSPLEFTNSILPTPYANLNESQRKTVLDVLQDKSMYTIEESSKVDTAGVTAYKYMISYDKDQYNKAAKAIAGYVDYFKADSTDNDQVKSMTIWVDINTKQLIKMEFTGTSDQGDVTGRIEFSDYNQKKSVERPSDYSIESELVE